MENPQPEPSMEEILASIRRIISEDEDEGAPETPKTAVKQSVAPKPEAKPLRAVAPEPAPAPQKIDETPEFDTEDVEMIKRNVSMAVAEDTEDAILGEDTATAASAAFTTLSQSVRVSEGPGKTIEQLVIEMLRPMVKEWLDENLPQIVEDKVEEEVRRVARRRG